MRLSSATVSEYVLALAQLPVSREGTLLYVSGQAVSVTEACGGIETLHAMIVVGLAAAYVYLGPKTAIWKWLPILFALAWCANTMRVLGICIGARYFGADLVQNVLHDLGGWLIVGAMIALCVAFFSCWRRVCPLSREPARIWCVGGTEVVRRFCQRAGTPGFVLWSMLVASIIVGSVWSLCPLPDAQERLRRLARVTEKVHGRDLPLTESERKRLGEATAVKRVYDVGGTRFTVTAIDGTRNRRVVHDPTYCWTVINESELPVDGGNAKVIRVVEDGLEKEMVFWFSDGSVRHASPIRYLFQTAVRRMTLGWAGCEPIFVLVEPCEAKTVNWFRFIDNFPSLFKI
jgi:exosortase/archaeosortase family protein